MVVEDKNTHLIDAIRKAVEEQPKFVYQDLTCKYFVDGVGSCLIGRGLEALGYKLEDLVGNCDPEDLPSLMENVNRSPAHELFARLDGFNPRVVRAIRIAQYHQDIRRPWNVCLDALKMSLHQDGIADKYWR